MSAAAIVLVGYRGAGKSTLGRLLAHRRGLAFIDLDEELVAWRGASISRLFEEHGEARFREWETELLARTLPAPDHVLAAGGGVVESAANRRLLRTQARAVFLDAPVELLVARLRAVPGRPDLTGLPLEDEVRAVLRRRDPWYREVADRVVPVVGDESPAETLARLEGALFPRSGGAD